MATLIFEVAWIGYAADFKIAQATLGANISEHT
jgi:hypothetical protein